MRFEKFSAWVLKILVLMSLLTPFLVSKDLLFPFVTTKAFYFRVMVELALPFYAYLFYIRKELRPNFKQPLNASIIIFLLVNLISAVFGVDYIKSLWGNFERMGGVFYLAHLTLFYFYLLMLGRISGNFLAKFLKSLVNLSVILVLYGMLMRYLSANGWLEAFIAGLRNLGLDFLVVPDPSLPTRSSITFGNPIYVGSFLIIPMFLAVLLAVKSRKRFGQAWWLIAAFLQLLGIYFSGTRGAVVGLALGLFLTGVVYLIFEHRHKQKLIASLGLSAFLSLGFLLFIFGSSLPHNINLARVIRLKDGNSAARLIQWEIAIKGYTDRPVFGTGPENYQVVSSKYHNPEIYQYDRSWFDKPHNYLLEILVTTGIFGFGAYLAMAWFSIRSIYQVFKSGNLNLFEFCILFAALIVYQIQNLFVFDNIAASLTFYILLAFSAHVYDFAFSAPVNKKNQKSFKPVYGMPVFIASSLLTVYAVVVGNIQGAAASKNTNYGYAYISVDPVKASEYFNKALENSANFDFPETVMKYSDFAMTVGRQNTPGLKPGFAGGVVEKATKALERVTESRAGNNPIFWQKLAQVYLLDSKVFESGSLSPKVESALQKAIELSPKRVEAKSFLAEVRLWQNRPGEAMVILKDIVDTDPTNFDAQWTLAVAENAYGQTNSAIARVNKLLSEDHNPKSIGLLGWLADYYVSNKDYIAAIAVYERAAKLNLLDTGAYKNLIQLYVITGKKLQAEAMANVLIKQNPSLEAELKILLNQK